MTTLNDRNIYNFLLKVFMRKNGFGHTEVQIFCKIGTKLIRMEKMAQSCQHLGLPVKAQNHKTTNFLDYFVFHGASTINGVRPVMLDFVAFLLIVPMVYIETRR